MSVSPVHNFIIIIQGTTRLNAADSPIHVKVVHPVALFLTSKYASDRQRDSFTSQDYVYELPKLFFYYYKSVGANPGVVFLLLYMFVCVRLPPLVFTILFYYHSCIATVVFESLLYYFCLC